MYDLISRQAAIDALGEEPVGWSNGEYELGRVNQWQCDVEAIEDLPPAAPQERTGKWIPCSERLPEKNGGYLATEKFSNYFPPQTNILYFAKNLYAIDKYDFATKRGEAGFYSRDDELGYIFTDCVIAWMPLPEPYREESNEHQG